MKGGYSMPRKIKQVIVVLDDGSAKRIQDNAAQKFQTLMTEAVALLPPEKAKEFHQLPWEQVKVTSRVKELKRS